MNVLLFKLVENCHFSITKRKNYVDSSTQTIESIKDYNTNTKFPELTEDEVMQQVDALRNIFDEKLTILKTPRFVECSIEISERIKVSENHTKHIRVTICVCYYFSKSNDNIKFYCRNINGLEEEVKSKLTDIERRFNQVREKDFTVLLDLFYRVTNMINEEYAIPKKTLYDDRLNEESKLNQLKIEQEIRDLNNLKLKNVAHNIEDVTNYHQSEEGNKFKNNTIKKMITSNKEPVNFDSNRITLKRDMSFELINTTAAKVYSRYLSDFEEICELGRGGFGAVFKVKNRLDGNFYAIKKINFKYNESKDELRKIMSEVKLLSNLNHPNIVRYYQAWFEETDEQNDTSGSSEDFSEIEEFSEEYSENENDIARKKSHAESNGDDDLLISFGDDTKRPKDNIIKQKNKILFIQMEYCPSNTLKEYLPRIELKKDTKTIKNFLFQITDALNYIHYRQLIHRDLKPSNIFLDENYNVKLGDFGLAKHVNLKIEDTKSLITKSISNTMSLNIGTPIYMSPEQQHSNKYDNKVDMYALGIILFEMLMPQFNTEMERVRIIKGFTNDQLIPDYFKDYLNDDLVVLMRQLINKDPSNRPSAKDVYLKFQDSLYHQLIISDINEYKKIINYVFTNKNKFAKFIHLTYEQQNYLADAVNYKYQQLNSAIKELLNGVLGKYLAEEITLNPLITYFNNVEIISYKVLNNTLTKYPILIEKNFSIDNYSNHNIYIDEKGGFKVECDNLLLQLRNHLIRYGIDKKKIFNLQVKDKGTIALSFANIIKEKDLELSAQIYYFAESLKIIDDILGLFNKYICDKKIYISHSILLDLVCQKMNLKLQEYSDFYSLIRNFYKLDRIDFNNLFNNKFRHLKGKYQTLIEFLNLKDINYNEFLKKLMVIFPNAPLIEIFKRECELLLNFIRIIKLKHIDVEFWAYPPLNEYTPLIHCGFILYMGTEDQSMPLLKKNKILKPQNTIRKDTQIDSNYNISCVGGRIDNLLSNIEWDVDTTTCTYAFTLNIVNIFDKIDHKTQKMIMNPSFSTFYMSKISILLVSLGQGLVEEKIKVASDLWNLGFKVIIVFEEIIFIENIYKKAAQNNVFYVILLRPGFMSKNSKVKIKIIASGSEMDIDYAYLLLKFKHRIDWMNENVIKSLKNFEE